MRKSGIIVGIRTYTRKGLTLIEAGIVLVILGIIVAAVFMVAPKLMNSSKGDSAYQQVQSVINATEQVKSLNGGAYKVGTGALLNDSSTNNPLYNELGGIAGTKDIGAWTYTCPAGAASTITIKTSALESDIVAALVRDKIKGRMAPWDASVAGSIVTITKGQSNCQ